MADPTGQQRLLMYPPLFFVLIGSLIWNTTADSAFLVIAIISTINLVLSVILFYQVAIFRSTRLDWYQTIVIAISVIGLSTFLLVQQSSGRTETLSTFWLLLGIGAMAYTPLSYQWLPLGMSLGLITATHPGGVPFYVTLIGIYFATRYRFQPVFINLTLTGVASVLTFLIALSIGPHNPLEVMSGMFSAGDTIASRQNRFVLSATLLYWVTNPRQPFALFLLLLTLIYLLFILVRYHHQIGNKTVFLISTLLFLYNIHQIVMYFPERIHYIMIFAPLFFAVIIWFVTHDLPTHPGYRRALQVMVIVVLLLTTIGFIRSTVLFLPFINGVTASEARASIQSMQTDGKIIGFTTSMWMFFEVDDYRRMRIVGINGELGFSNRPIIPDILFVQQNYSGLLTPPMIDGYDLVYQNFISHPQYLFGIKIANTTPGYSYAIYERSSDITADKATKLAR